MPDALRRRVSSDPAGTLPLRPVAPTLFGASPTFTGRSPQKRRSYRAKPQNVSVLLGEAPQCVGFTLRSPQNFQPPPYIFEYFAYSPAGQVRGRPRARESSPPSRRRRRRARTRAAWWRAPSPAPGARARCCGAAWTAGEHGSRASQTGARGACTRAHEASQTRLGAAAARARCDWVGDHPGTKWRRLVLVRDHTGASSCVGTCTRQDFPRPG